MAERNVVVCDQCGNEVAETEAVTVTVHTGRPGRPSTLDLCPTCAATSTEQAVAPSPSDIPTTDPVPRVSRAETHLADLEHRLWAAADELRANSSLTPAQYRDPVLGLIFLAFAEHRFEELRPEL